MYSGGDKAEQVLFDGETYTHDGNLAYHFKFRKYESPGFVNLIAEEVETLITK